jgi:glycosyltransferase involved in cell wall biosynthesis
VLLSLIEKGEKGPLMRAISFLVPQAGGVWGVFENLRQGLAPYGIELRWLAAGESSARLVRRAAPADKEKGDLIATDVHSGRASALSYYRYLTEKPPQLLIVHALQTESNLTRYLPPDIMRIMVVHTITPMTYRAARAVRDYVHATVAVSQRILDDLVRYCGFEPEWTVAIPNGIDLSKFETRCARPDVPPLRLLSAGRVEDIAKGVFWLPEIFRGVIGAGVDATLTVAGDGPDLEQLRRRFERSGLASRASFIGGYRSEEVASVMSAHQVLLFPSRFEGIGLTLIEALAAGCVPVATRIDGVTDTVVEHGRNGFLFPVGDVAAAASFVVKLARDTTLWSQMSAEARATARERFGLDRMAREYFELIQRVFARPRRLAPPLPIETWTIPRGLRPAWWHSLPEPLKNRLRALRLQLPRGVARLFNALA